MFLPFLFTVVRFCLVNRWNIITRVRPRSSLMLVELNCDLRSKNHDQRAMYRLERLNSSELCFVTFKYFKISCCSCVDGGHLKL